MEQAIITMLEQYDCKSSDEYENALKQIIQQISLLGLWRAKFFEHAAFYGGTALRILFKLERFSEDLDFSLLDKNKNKDIQLSSYLNAIQEELRSFGFETDIQKKSKSQDTAIQSAFLKANTYQSLIHIDIPSSIAFHNRKLLRIKFELDTDPPLGFDIDTKPILRPIPFWVKTFALPDLFAGKISAVLCRQWKNRVKGRDWFDFLWFIQNNVPVHLSHLESRLRQFNFYTDVERLSEKKLTQLLKNKVDKLDVKLAKQDIERFINEPQQITGWSKEVFIAAIDEMNFC